MLDTVFVGALINVSKNLAVLTCGVAAYCWLRRGPRDPSNPLRIAIEAVILGLIGLYSMINAASPQNGVILDARPILIALAALFSGTIVSAPLTAWLIIVRIWIGGIGTTPGIFEALLGLAFTSAYRDWLTRHNQPVRHVDLIFVSVLIFLPALAAGLFLPWQVVKSFVTTLNLSVLLGWDTMGLLILGTLIIWDDGLKRLQMALADDDARFRDVIDNLPISLSMRDRGGRVTLLNRRFREVYGPEVSQFVGQDHRALRRHIAPTESQAASERDEQQVEAIGRPTTRYTPDLMIGGEQRSILFTTFHVPDAVGRPDSLAVIGVDVSELRNRERETERLQSHLIQAGKMEAIGQLAGGIAHDFNNLLGAISGFASFLSDDLADRPEDQTHATRILALCDRAKSLVGQVLAFARADREDRQIIDVHKVIKDTLEFLRATLPLTSILSFDSGDEAIWLNANEGQVRQLIINLSINCSEALEGKPGRVAIHLRRIGSEEAEQWFVRRPKVSQLSVGAVSQDRSYVHITVSDDGVAIDQATVERLMEPFFSVMPNGAGSGLGLSIVHGIVLAYEGAYVIRSEIDVGTSFEIFLPETGIEDGVSPADKMIAHGDRSAD